MGKRQVVGFNLSGKMGAAPLDCVHNQDGWAIAGHMFKSCCNLGQIVAVNVLDRSAKGFDAGSEIAAGDDFLRATKSLQPVLVNDDRQVSQLLMHGEGQGLPACPLLPLAVRAQAIHMAPGILMPRSQRKSCREGGAMAQRACRKQQFRDATAAGVSRQERVIRSKC